MPEQEGFILHILDIDEILFKLPVLEKKTINLILVFPVPERAINLILAFLYFLNT